MEPLLFTALFWLSVAWSAVRPHHFGDWAMEIATHVGMFAVLAATFRRFRFTSFAYRISMSKSPYRRR